MRHTPIRRATGFKTICSNLFPDAMADNYLEKRMDDFRRGMKPSRRSGLLPLKPAATGLRAFVIGAEAVSGAAAVSALREAGWQVAFTHADMKSGRALAQSSGAQHHPVDPADAEALERSVGLIVRRWGAIDLVLCFSAQAQAVVADIMKSRKIPVIFCGDCR